MATPIVAGAAALMFQKDPTLTPDTVKARMMKTAWKGYPGNSWAYDSNGEKTTFHNMTYLPSAQATWTFTRR